MNEDVAGKVLWTFVENANKVEGMTDDDLYDTAYEILNNYEIDAMPFAVFGEIINRWLEGPEFKGVGDE